MTFACGLTAVELCKSTNKKPPYLEITLLSELWDTECKGSLQLTIIKLPTRNNLEGSCQVNLGWNSVRKLSEHFTISADNIKSNGQLCLKR